MTQCWTLREITFFSLVGQVWSTSDAYHKVATPSFLVVAQYLSQNSDMSMEAKATKLALCRILCYWVRDSKRYIPEAIQALLSILQTCEAGKDKDDRNFSFHDLSSATGPQVHRFAEKLVLEYASIYLSSVAFPDIFSPFSPYLTTMQVKDALQKSISNSTASRRPLSLQTHRPIPLATYIPKFEENFSLDKKSYDRNNDRAADSKLKAEIRDAKRGAVRVLRRDAAFEARENAKERRGKDAAYKAKIGKAENKLRQKDS